MLTASTHVVVNGRGPQQTAVFMFNSKYCDRPNALSQVVRMMRDDQRQCMRRTCRE